MYDKNINIRYCKNACDSGDLQLTSMAFVLRRGVVMPILLDFIVKTCV